MDEYKVIALVATPNFKQSKTAELRRFVYEHLYTLTSRFKVISTGNTHTFISDFIRRTNPELQDPFYRALISNDLGMAESTPLDEQRLGFWGQAIEKNFEKLNPGLEGMIQISHCLIQGKVDAVIQFSVGDDMIIRPGSSALRREANVHDVPIASDLDTAHAFVRLWKRKLAAGMTAASLLNRGPVEPSVIEELKSNNGDRVLALIAHDGKKEQMARFVVEFKDKLRQFDHILATGHSGEFAKQYLAAAGWSDEDLGRILRCKSGPKGGDVEIAMAVLQGRCKNVVFFQDPAISHPHEVDIRLFEQAIVAGSGVQLATNAASAKILLETIRLTNE